MSDRKVAERKQRVARRRDEDRRAKTADATDRRNGEDFVSWRKRVTRERRAEDRQAN